MLDTEPLVHPDVQAAKAKWDAAGNITLRKHRLSFEDWFEYFKADCIRFSAIGKEVDLSRQRVQQIYDKYFRELFEGKSGTERRWFCTLENHLVDVKRAESELFENDPVVKAVVEKARLAGCTIDAVAVIVGGRPLGTVCTKKFLINGHLCSLHHLENKWACPAGKRQYIRGSVSPSTLSKVEACIFHATLKDLPIRTFVIPSLVLQLKRRGSGPKKGGTSVYFPVKKLPIHRNCHDWWQYEDAWHLLPPKQNPPVP